MFCTPVISTVLGALSVIILKLVGWRVVGELPAHKKYVLLAAPHTSNWDFILFLLMAFTLKIDAHWMGKDSLFPAPFKRLMIWLGGIAIDRSKANNTVDQMVEHYNNTDELIVIVPPEGTRSKVEQWKTGFYHIAVKADVPIVQGFIDAGNKCLGFGPSFIPTGDIDEDMAKIRGFYAEKTGIVSANQ